MRCRAEADDLVQDALLAAFEQGRAWEDPATERWLLGVLWRRAAFLRRTAARRHRRDQAFVEVTPPPGPAERPDRSTLPELPPSLRAVARLAAAGCTRAEIQWVLGLRPATLRKRISELRRRLDGTAPPATLQRVPPGPIRATLLREVRRTGSIGGHDPDGHPVVMGCSHFRGARQL